MYMCTYALIYGLRFMYRNGRGAGDDYNFGAFFFKIYVYIGYRYAKRPLLLQCFCATENEREKNQFRHL